MEGFKKPRSTQSSRSILITAEERKKQQEGIQELQKIQIENALRAKNKLLSKQQELEAAEKKNKIMKAIEKPLVTARNESTNYMEQAIRHFPNPVQQHTVERHREISLQQSQRVPEEDNHEHVFGATQLYRQNQDKEKMKKQEFMLSQTRKETNWRTLIEAQRSDWRSLTASCQMETDWRKVKTKDTEETESESSDSEVSVSSDEELREADSLEKTKSKKIKKQSIFLRPILQLFKKKKVSVAETSEAVNDNPVSENGDQTPDEAAPEENRPESEEVECPRFETEKSIDVLLNGPTKHVRLADDPLETDFTAGPQSSNHIRTDCADNIEQFKDLSLKKKELGDAISEPPAKRPRGEDGHDRAGGEDEAQEEEQTSEENMHDQDDDESDDEPVDGSDSGQSPDTEVEDNDKYDLESWEFITSEMVKNMDMVLVQGDTYKRGRTFDRTNLLADLKQGVEFLGTANRPFSSTVEFLVYKEANEDLQKVIRDGDDSNTNQDIQDALLKLYNEVSLPFRNKAVRHNLIEDRMESFTVAGIWNHVNLQMEKVDLKIYLDNGKRLANTLRQSLTDGTPVTNTDEFFKIYDSWKDISSELLEDLNNGLFALGDDDAVFAANPALEEYGLNSNELQDDIGNHNDDLEANETIWSQNHIPETVEQWNDVLDDMDERNGIIEKWSKMNVGFSAAIMKNCAQNARCEMALNPGESQEYQMWLTADKHLGNLKLFQDIFDFGGYKKRFSLTDEKDMEIAFHLTRGMKYLPKLLNEEDEEYKKIVELLNLRNSEEDFEIDTIFKLESDWEQSSESSQLLFHGVRNRLNVGKIISNGFGLSPGEKRFGNAVYLTDHPNAAEMYTNINDKFGYIFLVESRLGAVFEVPETVEDDAQIDFSPHKPSSLFKNFNSITNASKYSPSIHKWRETFVSGQPVQEKLEDRFGPDSFDIYKEFAVPDVNRLRPVYLIRRKNPEYKENN